MKNFKKYFILTFTSLLLISCSTESVITENQNTESKSVENSTIGSNTNKPAGICGYIDDTNSSNPTLTQETRDNFCTPHALADIAAGNSYSYTFKSNDIVTSGVWSVYSGSGITFNNYKLTATGSTVTVNFAPYFTGGSIQVAGTDSTGQGSSPILNFNVTNLSEALCNCLPTLVLQAIDAGGKGTTIGQFSLEAPTNCSFSWSNVTSVKIQIGGLEFDEGTNLSAKIDTNTYNNWTNTPTSPAYNNMRILTKNNTSSAPGGKFTFVNSPGMALEGWATLTFNNGCSPKTIHTVLVSEL